MECSPSQRSTSGLSTSPSLPPPASLLAENAKPHLHPMMHSSPGISVLHSPLLTQQGKSPSWRIGGHWSRVSTPSSGALRLRTCSHPLQVLEYGLLLRSHSRGCPWGSWSLSCCPNKFLCSRVVPDGVVTQHNMLLQYHFFQCLSSDFFFERLFVLRLCRLPCYHGQVTITLRPQTNCGTTQDLHQLWQICILFRTSDASVYHNTSEYSETLSTLPHNCDSADCRIWNVLLLSIFDWAM